jgi:Holliday junction resolvase
MNRAAKGRRNEHRSRALLERDGYAVTRSAASAGVWDLIGIGAGGFCVVQVKTRDWPGREETAALEAFAVPVNCRKLVHRWRDGEQVPDVREL